MAVYPIAGNRHRVNTGQRVYFFHKANPGICNLLALILLKILQPPSKAVQRHARACPIGPQIVIDHRIRYQLENFVYRYRKYIQLIDMSSYQVVRCHIHYKSLKSQM